MAHVRQELAFRLVCFFGFLFCGEQVAFGFFPGFYIYHEAFEMAYAAAGRPSCHEPEFYPCLGTVLFPDFIFAVQLRELPFDHIIIYVSLEFCEVLFRQYLAKRVFHVIDILCQIAEARDIV